MCQNCERFTRIKLLLLGKSREMQVQICPRCKFRITSAKAICNTCGYSLQSARKNNEPAAVINRQVNRTAAVLAKTTAPASVNTRPLASNAAGTGNAVNANAAATSTPTTKENKTEEAAPAGGSSFWRLFFGLDPLPREKVQPR